jgi:hypothetical protein
MSWLRRSGRKPDAPIAVDLLWGNLGFGWLRFLLGSQHRQLADPLTTTLVRLARCALVAGVVGLIVLSFAHSFAA